MPSHSLQHVAIHFTYARRADSRTHRTDKMGQLARHSPHFTNQPKIHSRTTKRWSGIPKSPTDIITLLLSDMACISPHRGQHSRWSSCFIHGAWDGKHSSTTELCRIITSCNVIMRRSSFQWRWIVFINRVRRNPFSNRLMFVGWADPCHQTLVFCPHPSGQTVYLLLWCLRPVFRILNPYVATPD